MRVKGEPHPTLVQGRGIQTMTNLPMNVNDSGCKDPVRSEVLLAVAAMLYKKQEKGTVAVH